MTPPRRSARHPVRVAHLGLGAFHRAHQAWYTQAARIEHRLAQIAKDGSQKLGPRILDPLRARFAEGRPPGGAQAGVLAAWALHLVTVETAAMRDAGVGELPGRLRDAPNPSDRAALVVGALAPDLTERTDLVALIADRIASLLGAPA